MVAWITGGVNLNPPSNITRSSGDDVSKITHTTLGRAMPCLETRPVDFTYLSAFGVIVIARVQCNLADPWRPWYIITSGLRDYVQCML